MPEPLSDMIHHADLKVSAYEISLTRFIGKAVKDVRGYLNDSGAGVTFRLTRIECADGTFLAVEGEHDLPYLTQWGNTQQPHCDEATITRLYEEAHRS